MVHLVSMTTVLVLLCSVAIVTVSSLSSQQEALVEDFVSQMLKCRRIQSVSLALVNRTSSVLLRGYGRPVRGGAVEGVGVTEGGNVTERGEAVEGGDADPDTVYGVASLSKAMTAAVLGVVLQNHNYTWDTPIRQLLGDDFYFYDEQRTLRATSRDILSHRIGLPSYNRMRLQDGLTREELTRKIRFLKPYLPFRDSFKYNNLMLGLASHVTEKVGGDSWENLMTSLLFKPIGMKSTSFSHVGDLNDVVPPYMPDANDTMQKVHPDFVKAWGALGGSGSVTSSGTDMALYLRCLLNNGKADDGTQVLPESVVRDMFTPNVRQTKFAKSLGNFHRPRDPVTWVKSSYGIGWFIGHYRGLRMVTHTGTSFGWAGVIMLLPDVGVGVWAGMNGVDPGHYARNTLGMLGLDALLGETPWLNASDGCSYPASRHPDTKPRTSYFINNTARNSLGAALPLEEYSGVYGNWAFGNISFTLRDPDTLVLRYGALGVWRLVHKTGSQHTFDGIGENKTWMLTMKEIEFFIDEEGDNRVVVNGLDSQVRPEFVRGLQKADEPAPPSVSCGVNGATFARGQCQMVLVSMVYVIMLVYGVSGRLVT